MDALQFIAQHGMVGAEYDSDSRNPPLRCHPLTHKDLRDRIVNWVGDPAGLQKMLWISGPAGTGKSAITQTIAEAFKASGWLGSSLFFSRESQRDDPDRLVATLVYQLAVNYIEYKDFIIQRLSHDSNSTIFQKNYQTQFKELITEPFRASSNHFGIKGPSVIIMDGLDECKGEIAQVELAELIHDYVRTVPNSPLVWIISSRPEPHIEDLLAQPDFKVACICEALSIDNIENRQVEAQTPNSSPSPTPRYLLELLSGVLQNAERRNALTRLEGQDAQQLIDFLHSVLPELGSAEFEHRNHVLVTLYRLAKESQLYPQCCLLKDVVFERRPVATDSGGFCDVYRILHGGQLLCLRAVRVHEDERDRFLRSYSKEMILWSQLEHPNILPFYGKCYLVDESSSKWQACLVSPWMENGNIVKYLKDNLSRPRKPLICDVARGLQYLHQKDIVHGDLKGANILVTGAGRACLSDFGLSSVQADRTFSYGIATTAVFGRTTRWASPELLEEDAGPTKMSDIWAVGCVFYEILTGLVPFHECRTDLQILRKMSRGGLPADLDSAVDLDEFDRPMKDLIHLCWTEDPDGRPTCQKIIEELDEQEPSEEDGGDDFRDQSARSRQHFQDMMREDHDIQINLARIEELLREGEYPGPGCATEGDPILFYVKAKYDYNAAADEEFDFKKGDIIAVTATPKSGWWKGELRDERRRQKGRYEFPSNFVNLYLGRDRFIREMLQ
ncbi:kinase-like protein [Macrolepiota fuliginosa MF-IS2]|uniref:mitogen-activated protein kinase kinase kinase n=1 Tax=Macrolepiota fuliginosa MF-IS2 TaxID=1400762 RepID=A0A9P5X106_9AGAR|nr:kinase-like protein [Macrolepiota fuliginosa MF-IS2]